MLLLLLLLLLLFLVLLQYLGEVFEAFPLMRITVDSFSVNRILIIPAFSVRPKEGSLEGALGDSVMNGRAEGHADGEEGRGSAEVDVEVGVEGELGLGKGTGRGEGRDRGRGGEGVIGGVRGGGLRNSSRDITTLSSV